MVTSDDLTAENSSALQLQALDYYVDRSSSPLEHLLFSWDQFVNELEFE
jgi:hypothetical protein